MNLDYKKYVLIGLVVLAAGAVGIGSRVYFSADNAIEQAAEKVIQAKTGLNIDLSPDK